MDAVTISVFFLVYLGMLLGRLPGLALDRSGVALLGAIILVASGRVAMDGMASVVDLPTLALLFGLMILSAQFRLGGFYSWLVRRMAAAPRRPAALLALVMAAAGGLSAILANDIVCLAMAPMLGELCGRKELNPKPFLLGLALAANLGSAATLIGNPQNILIGQALSLGFAAYLARAIVPAVLGLGVAWAVLAAQTRGRWQAPAAWPEVEAPPFDAWQTMKGAALALGLVLVFLFSPWPRDLAALAVAGLLLASRRLASARMLALVDWPLLVLFIGLFVVNHALAASGAPAVVTGWLAQAGVDVTQPWWLFWLGALLSNLVSNVPAVMLLLPYATHPLAGPALALSSTLAGNLILVGSIANLIVVDQAARAGVIITWREHARVGVPVTLATLLLAQAWLLLL